MPETHTVDVPLSEHQLHRLQQAMALSRKVMADDPLYGPGKKALSEQEWERADRALNDLLDDALEVHTSRGRAVAAERKLQERRA